MVNICVLVSGGGTNLQALLDAHRRGIINSGEIRLVVSSKNGAFALERARRSNVEGIALNRRDFKSAHEFDAALLKLLAAHKIDVVVLAGFLCVLTPAFIEQYEDRILNVHPSLIPAFCGDGFYGLRVHEAALERGVKITGATVHLVNEITDGGKILLQKAVEVMQNDTAETLQKRVMEQAEWVILPQATQLLCDAINTKRGI